MTGPRRGRGPVTRFHLAIKVRDVCVPRVSIVSAQASGNNRPSRLQNYTFKGYYSFCIALRNIVDMLQIRKALRRLPPGPQGGVRAGLPPGFQYRQRLSPGMRPTRQNRRPFARRRMPVCYHSKACPARWPMVIFPEGSAGRWRFQQGKTRYFQPFALRGLVQSNTGVEVLPS